MERSRRERVRQRAKRIQKARKNKLTTKDYIQRALVVLLIVAILGIALFFTNKYMS